MTNVQKLISQNDFHHFYQPICYLPEENVLGNEALIRSKSNLSPDELFQHAIVQNQLFEIDTSSIFQAISIYFSLIKFQEQDDLLFVNIFPSTLVEPSFFTLVKKILNQFGRFRGRIVFEINETIAEGPVWNSKYFMESISFLRKQGFLIALDDVGDGTTTFKKIIKISPDFIKIDKFFSEELHLCKKRQKVVALFVEYCKDNCHLILEGIEGKDELAKATSLGITMGQGYLLGKPNGLN
jgi:EAL domain-containing protein (putative c-di-GMP-specific phosphodiesterase class I)